MARYRLYDDGSEYHNKLFETTNLNPFGRVNAQDGMYQALKVIRPDLSNKDILGIITEERIRRSEMAISGPMIGRIMKDNAPDYKAVKVSKKHTLKEIVDMCPSGIAVIRMGTDVVAYDAETGKIYTSLKKLYTQRPVSECWAGEIK